MFYGNPRIYNGAGVYQNGGGVGGTFNVDIGGGVSQEMTFPPYLVPVEYINTSDYTGSLFGIRGIWQVELDTQNDNYTSKIAYDVNKVTNNDSVMGTDLPFGNSGSNSTIVFKARPTKQIQFYYASIQNDITGANLHVDDYIIVKYKGANKQLLVYDGFGNSYSHLSNNGHVVVKNGLWNFLSSAPGSPQYPFHGQWFYSHIEKDGFVKALWVPARLKDSSNTQPYIVECVSGVVGINCSNNWSTSGIAFGPDIDLSDIGNYFQ